MFWLSLVLIILAVFALIWVTTRMAMLRSVTRAQAIDGLFAAQMAEINHHLAAGQINTTEAASLRQNANRNHRRAQRYEDDQALVQTPRYQMALVLVGCAILALVGYLFLGLPGLPDRPLAEMRAQTRPDYQTALDLVAENGNRAPLAVLDAETTALKTQLLAAIDTHPEDARGYKFLARILYTENDFAAAAEAQQQYIDRAGDDVRAEDHALLAETMILATNGYVAPEAELRLKTALSLDPKEPIALFYSAMLLAQTGRPDEAHRFFEAMRDQGIGGQEMQAEIERQLARLAPAKGPSAEDIANAAKLSDGERAAMIGDMVAQLEGRLAREGGTPADWARLINAQRVLGNNDKAAAILAEAREKFPNAAEWAQFE